MPRRCQHTYTHSVVELEVSESTFKEIFDKLKAADYEHTFMAGAKGITTKIDMHGIALTRKLEGAESD